MTKAEDAMKREMLYAFGQLRRAKGEVAELRQQHKQVIPLLGEAIELLSYGPAVRRAIQDALIILGYKHE